MRSAEHREALVHATFQRSFLGQRSYPFHALEPRHGAVLTVILHCRVIRRLQCRQLRWKRWVLGYVSFLSPRLIPSCPLIIIVVLLQEAETTLRKFFICSATYAARNCFRRPPSNLLFDWVGSGNLAETVTCGILQNGSAICWVCRSCVATSCSHCRTRAVTCLCRLISARYAC